jgi:hypothetical protein
VLTFFAVGLICDGAGRRCGNFARTLLGGRKADDKSLAGYLRWVAGTFTDDKSLEGYLHWVAGTFTDDKRLEGYLHSVAGTSADDKSLAGYLRWVAGTSTMEEEARMSTGTKRALEVPSDTTHTTADGRTVVDVRRLLNKEHVKETFRRIQDKIVIVRRPRRSLDSASES